MKLDPNLEPIARRLAEASPRPHKLDPAEWRRRNAKLTTEAKPPRPRGIRVEDTVAEARDRRVDVRIYRPAGGQKQPVLLYMHGGGWVVDSIDTHDAICADIANETPCTVVSVGYGLAPEHPFPAGLLDCEAALAWALANASRLEIDPGRVAVGGDSAGGNLAAALSIKLRESGEPSPVGYQVLLYAPLDLDLDRPSFRRFRDGPYLYRDLMLWSWNHYLQGRLDLDDPLAAPMKARDLSGLPPAYVVTPEYDPLFDEGVAYATRLVAAGVNVEYRRAGGLLHGFMRFRSISELADHEFQAVCTALRRRFDELKR
jgi:acetyl esterase